MKLLLYCTKAKPYLLREDIDKDLVFIGTNKTDVTSNTLNGKIVGECDFEVEEIFYAITHVEKYGLGHHYSTKNQGYHQLLNKSCLNEFEMVDYLKQNNGYAIHINNLHIFDKPRDLSEYIIKQCQWARCSTCKYSKWGSCNTLDTPVEKAPQNMMYVWDKEEKKVLISIRPEWLCKILNGEKTIEVRKKVLKEMV